MGDVKTSFFVLDIILLFVLTSLISMVFNLKKPWFIAVLFILVVLILCSFIALIGIFNKQDWGFILMSMSFIVMLIGLFASYYLKGVFSRSFIVSSLLSSIGFVIAVAGIKSEEEEPDYEAEDITKSFEPGKYVASKTGSTYHAPSCDWAKKIHKTNRVWFDDEAEAKKRFKAHSCLK